MNNRGGEGARLGLPDNIDDGFLLRLCEAAADGTAAWCAPIPRPSTRPGSAQRQTEVDRHGRGGLGAGNATRPPFVEADAATCRAFVRMRQARGLIAHTSSRQALEAGLRARDAGTDIVIETCPHLPDARHQDGKAAIVGKIESCRCASAATAMRCGMASSLATSIRSPPITCTEISRRRPAESGQPLRGARASKRCCR